MGKKADASTLVPLCFGCHHALHSFGPLAFETAYADMLCGRTLKEWAGTYAEAWEKWAA
jgi:hypothetical protein